MPELPKRSDLEYPQELYWTYDQVHEPVCIRFIDSLVIRTVVETLARRGLKKD
jgi:hypothetical protein